jgi:hypothetical protein
MFGFGIFGNVTDPMRPERDDPDMIRIRQEKKLLKIQRELAQRTFSFADLISGSNLSVQKQSLADSAAKEEAKNVKP